MKLFKRNNTSAPVQSTTSDEDWQVDETFPYDHQRAARINAEYAHLNEEVSVGLRRMPRWMFMALQVSQRRQENQE